MTLHHEAWRAAIAAALSTLAAAAWAAAPLAPLSFLESADLAAGTISFGIRLDRMPDFLTVDQYGRPADQIQYWINADASSGKNAMRIAYDVLNGRTDAPVSVISFGSIPTTGLLEIIRVTPCQTVDCSEPGRSPNGWGITAGQVAYSLDASRRLSFTVPLALIDDDDGKVSTYVEFYRYGGLLDGYRPPSAVAVVPEPSTAALIGLGALALGALRRGSRLRRDRPETPSPSRPTATA